MNAFEHMIDDLFRVSDFIEKFTDVDTGNEITCICTQQVKFDTEYTQFGRNDSVNFYLSVKAKDYVPVKNKRIIFRGQTYKIDDFELDAYGLSYDMHLKSLTDK